MVYVDINPVQISWDYKVEQEQIRNLKKLHPVEYRQYTVTVYGIDVFTSPWTKDLYSSDDYIETEWRDKWDTFMGESFRTWVKENS